MRKKQITEGVSLIPKIIKQIYIRKLFKTKFRLYYSKLNEYFTACNDIDKENKNKLWQIESLKVEKLKYPEKPAFSGLLNMITDEEFLNLIRICQQERVNWENLIAIEKNKILRSYQRFAQ